MEVHPLRRDPVHPTLGLADQPKGPHRPLLHPIRQRRALDQPHELADVPPMRLFGDREFDLRARHPGSRHLAHRDPHIPEVEATWQLFQPRRRGARGQERPQGHVARDAGGRVEDGDAHAIEAAEY